mmetsp:Transcript_5206/g.10779  ORF Transcript_5206/g.10779 Transcript_5206/m.10779 type:complete len:238 (-) Transcript_5206:1905-2618(-)
MLIPTLFKASLISASSSPELEEDEDDDLPPLPDELDPEELLLLLSLPLDEDEELRFFLDLLRLRLRLLLRLLLLFEGLRSRKAVIILSRSEKSDTPATRRLACVRSLVFSKEVKPHPRNPCTYFSLPNFSKTFLISFHSFVLEPGLLPEDSGLESDDEKLELCWCCTLQNALFILSRSANLAIPALRRSAWFTSLSFFSDIKSDSWRFLRNTSSPSFLRILMIVALSSSREWSLLRL